MDTCNGSKPEPFSLIDSCFFNCSDQNSFLRAEERGIVCGLSQAGLTQANIASHIKRSRRAVYECLKSLESKEAASQCGGSRKVTDRDLRALFREPSNTTKSAVQLSDML